MHKKITIASLHREVRFRKLILKEVYNHMDFMDPMKELIKKTLKHHWVSSNTKIYRWLTRKHGKDVFFPTANDV